VGRRAQISWALYDWAGNAFATVILSFVFSAYFTRAVAETPEAGTSLWGTTIAIASIAVALMAPIAGAVADQGGPAKPWLAMCTVLCVGATAGLWFVEPAASAVLLALILVGIGQFGFEMSFVFYNSMLPRLVPSHQMGRLSGWGWGLGYIGGLVILSVALFGLSASRPRRWVWIRTRQNMSALSARWQHAGSPCSRCRFSCGRQIGQRPGKALAPCSARGLGNWCRPSAESAPTRTPFGF